MRREETEKNPRKQSNKKYMGLFASFDTTKSLRIAHRTHNIDFVFKTKLFLCIFGFFLVQTNINSVTIFNKFNLFCWFEKFASKKTLKMRSWMRTLFRSSQTLWIFKKNHGGWWIESTFHKNQKLFKQKYIEFCLLF